MTHFNETYTWVRPKWVLGREEVEKEKVTKILIKQEKRF